MACRAEIGCPELLPALLTRGSRYAGVSGWNAPDRKRPKVGATLSIESS